MARFASRAIEDKPFAGILLILVAYLLFACIDTSSKWLGILGLGALQLSFMRYFGHFVISMGLFAASEFDFRQLRCEKIWLVLLRGALLTASTVFNFAALRYLPLTLTSTILFSAPIMVCVLSWPLLRERVGLVRWSAVALGFAGVAIAIKPFDDEFHVAVFMSLTAAFCFALYSVLTRKLAGVVVPDTMQFYTGLVGTVALAPFAIAEWQNPATGFQWSVLVGLGVLGWVGHQFLTNAMSFAPANLLMPFGYVFILYLTVSSYLVFDQLPDQWTVAGAAIIVLSGLIIFYRERMLYTRRSQ
ncbi:drug/metabolite transporter (DMT)-like permease [Labrenzia sp. EL_208]|uniref:DMT family transporter n=1 Tax=Roseibium album TaxID=311410 RepID=UPI000CF1784E|nr:DMT family transporter [Roseibium album]MBG6144845.1 drug/metabolite transporter (DMT)-like permease [Labrenzia sp. EL_142]MBG6156938.1 drug/metabolite transporter (DMT)-like permease [Labrenzia sp. EL_162]MBG6163451.1 drug/metabolite transporter (DMT)-like permease [Labrenzia sp. EL_195]MBG6172983.1 drug/metabolite transporter (DMT)-like permease [Labrenzia sp. EL_132]MBG6195121.1 drug/metabolite transporter (DMT)-like permease [Labrenzia sp. EL_159]MBG6203298.1 drug/metabolite transporte